MGVQNWLTSKIKLDTDNVHLLNYYTPINTQVEEIEPTDRLCSLQVGITQNTSPDPAQDKVEPTGARGGNLRVRFTIPPQHTDKDITACRQQPCIRTICAGRYWSHALRKSIAHPKHTALTE